MLREYVIICLILVTVSSATCRQPPVPHRADLRITQQHLVALCLDGRPVEPKQRRWQLDPGAHTLTFTMRNEPRWPGAGAGERPGYAVIRFRAEPGRRYEVEIRADPLTYSRRVWRQREWKPVVRDRDTLVSAEPTWVEARAKACQ